MIEWVALGATLQRVFFGHSFGAVFELFSRNGLKIKNFKNYAKIGSKSGFDCIFEISIPNYTD